MSIVRVLPDQVVNQIAAGEVVERPASVVKELMENALDAGATRIEVQLKSGGADRIRVSDDGSGMDREDAMMCLERHATSKIRDASDLDQIASLGFRGEAIPSIASVSRFTLHTRPKNAEEGVRIQVEGGEIRSIRAAGCAAGTEIDVADLFYNLPARRKFMRTRATELAHCTEAVIRAALARPEVAFRLTSDGRVSVSAPVTDRSGRARQVLGNDAQRLVEVAFERGGLSVAGLVSPLAVHRPAGKSLYLFVNGRYVRDAVVRRAVADAYRDRVPKGRNPLVVLHIGIDSTLVDVNVHPAKTEVRFRSPRDVQEALSEGIRGALRRKGIERQLGQPGANRKPRWSEEVAPALPLRPAPDPIPAHPDDDPLLELVPTPISAPLAQEPTLTEVVETSEVVEIPVAAEPPESWRPQSSTRALKALGPFGTDWFLLEGEGELVVVDHVRGARLLVERRLETDGLSQRLLVPKRERLNQAEVAAVVERAERLGEMGLEIVEMSPTELAIRAVPSALPRLYTDGLLRKLAAADPNQLASALAAAQTPGPPPDARSIRAMLASLDELGLDAVVARWPATQLVKGP